MPHTTNGIGTCICSGRGHVSWGGEEDRDSVECCVLLFMPVWPLRTVHVFDWQQNLRPSPGGGMQFSYRNIPIRWSWGLVAFAFLHRWLMGGFVVGLIVTIVALCHGTVVQDLPLLPGTGPHLVAGGIGGLILVGSVLCSWVLRDLDQRNCDIRRVLGRHQAGSSDPATWTSNNLISVRASKLMFGVNTYAEAVPLCLDAGNFAGAMWAARLTAALESRRQGEELTNDVLNYPGVREAIGVVRKAPQRWGEVMQPSKGRGANSSASRS